MAIDFTEIPEAHKASGDQDTFELFARDFLEAIGFTIVEGPGRGIDRGRDLIVTEPMKGIISTSELRWVVSAKHKAHSGSSVADRDEIDIKGRVDRFKAEGFLGFYSTLASSGLDDTLTRLSDSVKTFLFDRARIENFLFKTPALQTVFQRYFPNSYRSHKDELLPEPERVKFVFGDLCLYGYAVDHRNSAEKTTFEAATRLSCRTHVVINNTSDRSIGFHDLYVIFEREGAELARFVPTDEDRKYTDVRAINVEPHRSEPCSWSFLVPPDAVNSIRTFHRAYFAATSTNGVRYSIPLVTRVP